MTMDKNPVTNTVYNNLLFVTEYTLLLYCIYVLFIYLFKWKQKWMFLTVSSFIIEAIRSKLCDKMEVKMSGVIHLEKWDCVSQTN